MPNYRRLFISGYNYIFITFVTQNRINILIKNIDLLRNAFKYAISKFDFEIFAIAVLDDHIHLILKLDSVDDYPKIIYTIKNYISRRIDKSYIVLNKNRLSDSKIKRKEKGIWQRRYWEHIIRNEQDLYKYLDYIHYNPVKHGFVKAPKEWEYSSFKKYVKMGLYEEDWCNLNDENSILGMEIE